MLEEVIDGGEDSEDSEPSSEAEAVAIAERLNDRRVQLAGFLKLVLFGVLEMKVAAPVFAQYVRVSPTQYILSHTSPLAAALSSFWRSSKAVFGSMS